MKILITGAAGFLGLHLATFFSRKGYNLILVDRVPFRKEEYPKGCQFIISDIRDKKSMDSLCSGVDFVIHAAAALPLCTRQEIMDVNVKGTKILLDISLKYKVKRFVYISSTAVYGIPKKHPIYENDAKVGVGAYGESKILAEQACFNAIKKGLNVTIIRPKTFVGTHRLGVFEILFDWIHDGKKIPMLGSGNNRYQLLDVDDLTEATYLFIQKDTTKYNSAFNIGAEKFNTVKKDLGELFKYAHSGSKIIATPAFLIKKILWFFEKLKLSPLYQWVYDTADKDSFVSIEKLTKTLDWHPRFSNSEALIKAYQWYLYHYDEIKLRKSGTTHTVGWKQGILGLVKKVL